VAAPRADGVSEIGLPENGWCETSLYDARMPMKVTTVRFSESLYAAIEEQARLDGVSAAQFICEAAILRLGQLLAEQQLAEAGENAVVPGEG